MAGKHDPVISIVLQGGLVDRIWDLLQAVDDKRTITNAMIARVVNFMIPCDFLSLTMLNLCFALII